MKFRQSNNSPPYMNRAFQWRMIMMVLSLGVVVFSIKVTAQPSFWAHLFPEEETQTVEKKDRESLNDSRQIVRVEMDEFLATQNTAEDDEGDSDQKDQSVIGADSELPSATVANESNEEIVDPKSVPDQKSSVESELPELPDESVEANVEISPDRFLTVEDYSVGVRSTESDSFFHVISHASRVPLEQLKNAAEANVAREALLTAPDHYRGEVIQIEGVLRRLEKVSAELNGYGIEEYYIAWIITPTSDNIPYRVAAMFVDDALPVSDLITEEIPVKVSGYFYKIQGYASRSDLQLTPLFIARKISLAPVSDAPISLTETSHAARWLFVVFGAMFAIAIWSVYRSTVGSSRMRSHRKDSIESRADLSDIQGESSIDPGEELRKLKESSD